MLEWQDKWGQNGRGMVVAKEVMLPPIVCDRDAFIPLYGIYSCVYTYIYLYLLNIYIFVRFLLVACSNGNLTGATLNGHIGVVYQPKC
jgi:hypothetical protein